MKRMLVVEHKTGDYEQWKRVFDETEARRSGAGLRGGWILRDLEDPKSLAVCLECTDVEKARAFLKSPYVKEAMKRAGVVGDARICFLEEVATVPELAAAGADLEYD